MNHRALFGSSNISYFVFISKNCNFLNLRTKTAGYPFWHLVLTHEKCYFSHLHIFYTSNSYPREMRNHTTTNPTKIYGFQIHITLRERERERELILFVGSRIEICCLIGSSGGLVDLWWLLRQHVGVYCVLSLVFLW